MNNTAPSSLQGIRADGGMAAEKLLCQLCVVPLQEQAEQATMKAQIGAVQTQVDQLAQQVKPLF